MKRQRPFGITILAVLIGIGALIATYHTLQFLHLLPFSLGPLKFFAFDFLAAFLWGVNAAILFWVASSLWNLRMEGRLFVLVIAAFDLILAFMTIIGGSSFQAMLPAILINAIILIYCLLPGVEKAFSQESQPTPAAAVPPAPPASAPVVPAAAEVTRMSSMPEMPPEAAVAPAVVAAAPEDEVLPVLEVEPEDEALPVLEVEPEPEPVIEPGVDEPAGEVPVYTPTKRQKVPIETIEGIGPVYRSKLGEAGIKFVADLLEAGASRKGREDLVATTGISSALILKWVNMADLMRISGVGEEYSELLEAAGVDTVKELRNRNPENLHEAMLQANLQRKMVRRTPYLSEVQSWVKQAKELAPVITY